MHRVSFSCVLGVAVSALAALGPPPAAAEDPDESVVHEILRVLDERGLLEEGQYESLSARYVASEKERDDLLSRLQFHGDARVRYEGIFFQNDETGVDRRNRNRGRYRLRLGADAEVNDYVFAHLRLASGEDDLRSTNTSFGRPGPDFDPDPIFIDRAYVELRAPEERVPLGGTAGADIGKLPNPFVWKSTRDWMLWDNDINPEGVALRLRGEAATGLELFANGGFFVIDENSSAGDPHLFGAQVGAEWEGGALVAGGRASWFGFRQLDDDFVCRGVAGREEDDGTCSGDPGSTAAAGNLFDGLAGGGDTIDVVELAAYVGYGGLESWPIRLFGHLGRNFSARNTPTTSGSQDLAWGVGLEAGSKKEIVLLGLGYWHIEANAFPAQFIDSDLFDGVTNREGFAFWGSRRVLPNTDLNLTLFLSDAIETQLPAYQLSVAGSERIRLQTDLVVEF